MTLKDFLLLWTENELVAIIYRSVSNGAYTVKELLSHEKYLNKTIKCSEIHVEKADNFIAEDSLYRDRFLQGDVELPYICLELCD